MSSPRADRRRGLVDRVLDRLDRVADVPFRTLALVGILAMVFAYATVFYWVGTIVGGRVRILALLAVAFVAGTLLRDAEERIVLAIGGGALAVGGLWYVVSAMGSSVSVLSAARTIVLDTVSLATGSTILGILEIDRWILAVLPAPTLLAWYLALRGRYVLSVGSAGFLLLFLALTGDAPPLTTLVGVLGAITAVGAGELASRDLPVDHAGSSGTGGRSSLVAARSSTSSRARRLSRRELVTLLGAAAASGWAAPVAGTGGTGIGGSGSGGSGEGGDGSGGSGEPVDLEGALVSNDEMVVSGQVDLTPEVRFVVEADEARRWRTDAYDRYDGSGWIRTGDVEDDGALRPPVGETTTVAQRYDIRESIATMPAAATPVGVFGVDGYGVDDMGTLTPSQPFGDGDAYAVQSEIPAADADALDVAGTDYPGTIERRYTQVPSATPARVADLTAEVTADADTPFQTAVVIEDYLQATKTYSLEVEPPSGDIADQFLFEMDAGYCTYYATTMVVMARTQGIPARMVVGYNPGEPVDGDAYVVRGSDAHAWVELYFPDIGWVEFDPTPAAAWSDARSVAIEEAREEGDVNVDTPETREAAQNADDDTDPSDVEGSVAERDEIALPEPANRPVDPQLDVPATAGTPGEYTTPEEFEQAADGSMSGGPTRVRERAPRLAVSAVVLAGVAAGISRTGLSRRVARPVRTVYQPRRSPESDLERAIDRLETVLARDRRARRPHETDQEYLDRLPGTIDPRLREIYDLRERARYAGEVDPELVDRVVDLVDEYTRERTPVARWFT